MYFPRFHVQIQSLRQSLKEIKSLYLYFHIYNFIIIVNTLWGQVDFHVSTTFSKIDNQYRVVWMDLPHFHIKFVMHVVKIHVSDQFHRFQIQLFKWIVKCLEVTSCQPEWVECVFHVST